MNAPSLFFPRWAATAAGGLIAVAALAAYANSFGGPFVYDDGPALANNATLHHFASAFFPPAGTTTSGRPLVNLSFALNYAISGPSVWSYHALNLLIHLAAGLALFGVVRFTLARSGCGFPVRQAQGPEPVEGQPQNHRLEADATFIACGVALLWTIHPLQTESVTYVVQRAESLMGLCYLLTLYFFVRGLDAPMEKKWFPLSFAACLAGMASKEVMASAPLMVLLFDRTFVAGSFRAAWTARKKYYAALASTWLLLAVCVASTGGNRGGTVGLDVGVGAWAYGLTQFRALTRYLALSFWPEPLVFEYGTFWETSPVTVVPHALVIVALLGVTAWALVRRPALGFLGAWFFVMLAPTSLVPGTTQMIVEHRMYLSLAAVLVLAVVAAHAWLGARSLFLFFGAAAVLVGLTFRRNADYRTEVSLWADTAAKRPANALAHCNLAIALVQQEQLAEAIAHYETSLHLAPNAPNTHYNYAVLLGRLGQKPEAIAHYEHAIRYFADFPSAHSNLGTLLFLNGRAADSIPHLEQALRLKPDDSDTHCTLANALYQTGRTPDALAHYARALELNPPNADHHYNFANTLFQLGRMSEAIAHYEQALRLRPDEPDTHFNLALALEQTGHLPEATAQLELTLRLRANDPAAREALARVRAALRG